MSVQIEFDVRTPVSDEGLIANVRHALGLGLPELRDFEYAYREAINIIANGPSALQAPLTGYTVALNGALGLFGEGAPTYWAACDPQALVADFLGDPPAETTYLVASKCHPSVFERLQGRNVVLWHVADEATLPLVQDRQAVARASSITICTFELMARLGFRKFETWGWDACLMDGRENAVAQHNEVAPVTVEVGGERTFQTSHTWALEAQDAVNYMAGFPFPIHVHGGGLVGEMLRLFKPSHIVTDHQ